MCVRSIICSWYQLVCELYRWIGKNSHYKVWDELSYPFPNFDGATVEIWDWINNFIPRYSILGSRLNHVNKRGPWCAYLLSGAEYIYTQCRFSHIDLTKHIWMPFWIDIDLNMSGCCSSWRCKPRLNWNSAKMKVQGSLHYIPWVYSTSFHDVISVNFTSI